MTDRDEAMSPDHDDIPREPSKHELDAALNGSSAARRPATDDDAASVDADAVDIADPIELDETSGTAAVVTYPPSKAAVIASALLAAVLLALSVLAFTQDPKDYMSDINHQQVGGLAKLLEDEKVASYSDDEVKAAQEAFKDAGAERDMTNENAAEALNSAKPDSVTADQIGDLLKEKETRFQTLENLKSGLRSQIIMFAVAGVLMAVAAVFYQRGKVWARFLGMFVAGFVAVLYVTQVVQGALNIPGLVITLAAVAAFYFLMKGRLEDRPVAAGGRPGGLGFGSLFTPRGPRNKPAE